MKIDDIRHKTNYILGIYGVKKPFTPLSEGKELVKNIPTTLVKIVYDKDDLIIERVYSNNKKMTDERNYLLIKKRLTLSSKTIELFFSKNKEVKNINKEYLNELEKILTRRELNK